MLPPSLLFSMICYGNELCERHQGLSGLSGVGRGSDSMTAVSTLLPVLLNLVITWVRPWCCWRSSEHVIKRRKKDSFSPTIDLRWINKRPNLETAWTVFTASITGSHCHREAERWAFFLLTDFISTCIFLIIFRVHNLCTSLFTVLTNLTPNEKHCCRLVRADLTNSSEVWIWFLSSKRSFVVQIIKE